VRLPKLFEDSEIDLRLDMCVPVYLRLCRALKSGFGDAGTVARRLGWVVGRMGSPQQRYRGCQNAMRNSDPQTESIADVPDERSQETRDGELKRAGRRRWTRLRLERSGETGRETGRRTKRGQAVAAMLAGHTAVRGRC
jgi:hypothetical protein